MEKDPLLSRLLRFPALRVAVVGVLAGMIIFGMAPLRAMAGEDSAGGVSAPSQASSLLDRIQDHYQHTESFSAKFSEELTGVGRIKRIRAGRVFYRRPGKMRWEFAPPQNETVVSDGHKFYDHQPDLNQVVEVPVERAFKSAAPLAFLLGIGDIRRDFKASLPLSTPSDSLVHVVLVPKGGGDRIEMGLEPSNYNLMAVKVTDALGNTTSIKFSDVRTNVKLAESLFTFELPAGADVVEAPGAAPGR
jgi:outer membrane lipoprotein carrier protein